ncbi:hypothetical protein CCACVL1_11816 [Corchorus capsularis]|uniref:Uncharacterized protein n=1 Tax=Corchorus capsularis TaxID=210143 RepID=A0A1R3IJC2_COCAP|nr:hypothetical protein CCACVL1_11816 [Corchorus capsularis]
MAPIGLGQALKQARSTISKQTAGLKDAASDARKAVSNTIPRVKTGLKMAGTFGGDLLAVHGRDLIYLTSSAITVKAYVFNQDEEIKKIGHTTQELATKLDDVKATLDEVNSEVKILNNNKRFRFGFC